VTAIEAAVLIMARAPRPGTVKTRLQPLLGPGGCARLQAALIRHTVALAQQVATTYVAVDSPGQVDGLVPAGVTVLPQVGDNLGTRMHAAIAQVGGPVVVIGTDAPTLTADHLRDAAKRLAAGDDVVFGPALDGGYYLVAVRRPRAEPFAIDPALWGGPDVLPASTAAAEAAGLRAGTLAPLRDLDTPEDARALLADGALPGEIAQLLSKISVSIVVPVLNEADRIEAALHRLRADFPDCELVVVDGGSTDGTAELAEPLVRVIHTGPGRARQMNEGARHTSGTVLWFVHADSVIDPTALTQLRAALRDPATVGGGLTLRFDRRSAGLHFLAHTSNMRARRLHQIFGDQALFVRRSVFDTLGGFPPLPLMEDLELSRRLHRAGRLALLPATSTASARRFDRHGTWRMVAFMQYLKLLYFAGVSPESIHRRYEAGPASLLKRRRSDGIG
jgi:rSAM/selenodomain-associated transferase 2/rSAM/selenodomain-associated transferase 1